MEDRASRVQQEGLKLLGLETQDLASTGLEGRGQVSTGLSSSRFQATAETSTGLKPGRLVGHVWTGVEWAM